MLSIALLGFADATYLSIEHLRGAVPNCTLLEGCDVVTTSAYSEIFGIPVALGGSFYYLTIFLLLAGFLDTKKETLLHIASMLTPLGFLFSAWFVYVQLIILEAICIYCMGSAISSTLLFLLGMMILKKTKATPKTVLNTIIL